MIAFNYKLGYTNPLIGLVVSFQKEKTGEETHTDTHTNKETPFSAKCADNKHNKKCIRQLVIGQSVCFANTPHWMDVLSCVLASLLCVSPKSDAASN